MLSKIEERRKGKNIKRKTGNAMYKRLKNELNRIEKHAIISGQNGV